MKLAASLLAIAALAGSALAFDNNGSGVVVLDTNAEGALTLTGNSVVQVPARAVYVNSSHSRAVRTNGTATLQCPNLYVVGGASFTGGSSCTGSVIQSCNAYQNPLAASACPSSASMAAMGTRSIEGGSHTLSPGYYAGITVSGNAQVTFMPGVYVIGGNGLRVNSGSIVANQVCFAMVEGSLHIAGSSSLSMSPPSEGSMAGMTIIQSASNESGMYLAGGGEVNVSGTIYAPAAEVRLVGNSQIEGQGPQMGDLLVSKRVHLSGIGIIKIGRAESQAIILPKMPLAD